MRKTVLYIAMSLDGYIADENGGVGWLEGYSGIEGSWEALKVMRRRMRGSGHRCSKTQRGQNGFPFRFI